LGQFNADHPHGSATVLAASPGPSLPESPSAATGQRRPGNLSSTICDATCAPRALHRRTSDDPSVIPQNARRCRPTQLSSLQKAHSCDRHHIASAMAELASYLSMVPHMRSFDVPPKDSAPLTRGFFWPLDFLRRESAIQYEARRPAEGARGAPLGLPSPRSAQIHRP
jgi:hypothetical protein